MSGAYLIEKVPNKLGIFVLQSSVKLTMQGVLMVSEDMGSDSRSFPFGWIFLVSFD